MIDTLQDNKADFRPHLPLTIYYESQQRPDCQMFANNIMPDFALMWSMLRNVLSGWICLEGAIVANEHV